MRDQVLEQIKYDARRIAGNENVAVVFQGEGYVRAQVAEHFVGIEDGRFVEIVHDQNVGVFKRFELHWFRVGGER